VVRPDGKISLPMLNDLQAVGLKPEELAEVIEKAAFKYIRDPQATVMVKQIKSRKITVIGQVSKSGSYPLSTGMTVLQAIGEAGGFTEDANKSDITIVRIENGVERRHKFNYNEVVKGKKTQQNIRLVPGDTILVR
jgi:polysaccharide export outer membrane protein